MKNRKRFMKAQSSILFVLLLSGCASMDDSYYQTVKAVSKDTTMTQIACWNAVTELSKHNDQNSQISALTLAEKCRYQSVVLEPPKKSILGF